MDKVRGQVRPNILAVCSSGGHLRQMLRVISILDGYNVFLVTEENETTRNLLDLNVRKVLYLPHGGREQKMLFPFKFFANCVISFFRLIKYRPKLVLSTGAHTAVPSCYLSKLFGARVIYIESFAKINTPSMAGKLVYPVADVFYVQWPDLLDYYPKAKMCGRIY